MMDSELREHGLVEPDDGVSFLFGLMLSLLLSLGLWVAGWWIGLLLQH